MHKFFLMAATALALNLPAAEVPSIGIVNFSSCITESKSGKKEQENMEAIRKQLASLVEDTERELREISSKFEDPDYLDSLSPKAEEEMKTKFQALQEDLGRYQNQFYQVLNHAQYQMVQRISGAIAKAAEKVAEEKHLDYVLNKEVCFFANAQHDVTTSVIDEMDQFFDLEMKAKQSDAAASVNTAE